MKDRVCFSRFSDEKIKAEMNAVDFSQVESDTAAICPHVYWIPKQREPGFLGWNVSSSRVKVEELRAGGDLLL